MKVEEASRMRHWIVAAVVGMMTVSAHAATIAAGPIKLSDGIDAACEAIAAAPATAPQVMLVDVPTIDASGVRSLLDAINDRREAKGSVMAVCTSKTAPTREGAAIVALACDAHR
jgi:ABC-type histidine transport system ATPase subunit